MSSTTFTDEVTPIVSTWLNDVDQSIYVTVPQNTSDIAAEIARATAAESSVTASYIAADAVVAANFAASDAAITAAYLAADQADRDALAVAGGSALVGTTQAGTGAVARTVQSKLRESISVKDFGAVGDGVADDTAAIQAALDYASATCGTLIVPPGVYLGNFTVKIGVSVIGAGPAHTRFEPVTDNPVFTVYGGTTEVSADLQTNYVQFKNFRIDGSATQGTTSNQHGIWIEPALSGVADNVVAMGINNLMFEQVTITSMSGRGIHCRAQPWSTLGLARYVQSMQGRNIIIQGCTLAGLYISGHIIECQFYGLRLANNGSLTGASAAADADVTRAEKLKSNLVIKAEPTNATPTTSGHYIMPGRFLVDGAVLSRNAGAGTHEALNVYIDGGRQIMFRCVDTEGDYRWMEVESSNYATNSVINTWDVSIDTVNGQANASTIENFIQLNHCKRFNFTNVTCDAGSSSGVFINTTAYSKVSHVTSGGGNAFNAAIPMRDLRVESVNISTGALTIRDTGVIHIAHDGVNNPTILSGGFAFQKQLYSPMNGDVVTLVNQFGIPVRLFTTTLAAFGINLTKDIELTNAASSMISLQYNGYTDTWVEVARSAPKKDTATNTTTYTNAELDMLDTDYIVLGATVAASVVGFSNGYIGQTLTIRFTTANTTLKHNYATIDPRAELDLIGAVNKTYASGDWAQFYCAGDKWVEIARNS